MKIYTKTGDDGTTGIQNSARVSKSDLRIISYGAVDEINSSLGIILSHALDNDIKNVLTKIQNELFIVGSDLSNPNLKNKKNRITDERVESLESDIDQFEKSLNAITKFILPGGNAVASLFHISRTITRRAETNVVSLSEKEAINPNCQKYLNRLSDLLFVLARTINKRDQVNDVFWEP